ncbi:PAS domain S-box protein [bacterium]|nr:PAS domain S-box protein [bacterium]
MSSEFSILHAGSSPVAASALGEALRGLPVALEHCALASEAVALLAERNFDLLLLELDTDSDPAGLLTNLHQRCPGLACAALVEEHATHAAVIALRSGMDDCLVLDSGFGEQLKRCILRLRQTPLRQLGNAGVAMETEGIPEGASLFWENAACAALIDENGNFITASPALEELLQAGPGRLRGRQLHDFVDICQVEPRPVAEIGSADSCFMAEINSDGGPRGRLLIGLTSLAQGERSLRLLQARDVTVQHRSSVLAGSQTRLVEMLMAGIELEDILESLAHSVGLINPGCVCSVMIADNESGCLRSAFPPQMSELALELLDRLRISEEGSCCGMAAFRGERVVSPRLADDGQAMQRLEAAGLGLGLCVAQPVISASGTVLGVLALYMPEGMEPVDDVFHGLEIAANLAGVAIDRLQTEQLQQEIEARYRNMFEHSPLAMQVYSTDGRALRGNQVWQRMFAQRRGAFEDYNILEDPQIAAQGLQSYVRRGFGGEATELPLLRQPEGSAVQTPLPFLPWTRCFIYGIASSEGRPGEVLLVHEDLSDRRRTEDSLRHSEERFRSLVEGADDLIFTVSRNGILTAINAAFEQQTSHAISEWIGRNPLGLLHPDDHRRVQQLFLSVMRGRGHSGCEVRFRGSVQGYTEATLSAIPIEEDGRISGAFFTLRDDSERRLVEEERLRLLTAIERVDEMILITDRDGRIVYVNPAFERISGYRLKDVRQFTARILRSEEHDDAFFAAMWGQLAAGQVWRGEIVNRNSSGGLFRVDAAITPIVGSSGEVANYVGVLRDITTKSLLESRLQHTQKMEAIGSLAGGIAHDFNNILAAIIGYTQIVKRELPGNARMQSNLDSVLTASRRATDLVRQILTFSQHRETRSEAVCTQRIVREVLKLIRASLPSTIEIRQNLLDLEGTVFADATQLHQVVMNLCTNAGQAMEENGGILEVDLSRYELEDGEEAAELGISPGSYQILSVSDTGEGMDDSVRQRIFEPFFTTKETGRGTGLGLSVVHGIVSRLGGAIRVHSNPGLGSEFSILLPRSENVEELLGEPDFDNIEGSERVLLVDDEEMVAAMADQALRQLGYQVTRTLNPEDALRLFELDPEAFDILITDQTMPGLTGVQLTQALHGIRPELPVILCTGFSRTVNSEMLGRYGLSAFLDKPASPQRLAATIRQVLDRRSANHPVSALQGQIQ